MRQCRENPYLYHLLWWSIKTYIRLYFPKVQPISTDELFNLLNQPEGERPIILDTRTEQEYTVSHIYQAQLVNPNTTDFTSIKELNTGTPIVTYCSVGYRSSVIADKLQKAGYTQVFNLEGSIFQWVTEGKPVYQHGRVIRQVHPYNEFWGRLLPEDLHSKSVHE